MRGDLGLASLKYGRYERALKYGGRIRAMSPERWQRLVGQELFEKDESNPEKLALCGCSNCSESLKQNFMSLAPKRLHFSDSESYDFRLNCAVASKNIGSQFLP